MRVTLLSLFCNNLYCENGRRRLPLNLALLGGEATFCENIDGSFEVVGDGCATDRAPDHQRR